MILASLGLLALSAGIDGLLSDPTLPDVPVIRLANGELVSLGQELLWIEP